MFIDLDPATFNATGKLVEAAITPRTKAIMPVHLFGQLAEMPAIMAVAAKHGIPVIEDACQSLGAKGWGKSAGQFGDLTGCSFYPTKNLGAFGDAGMTLVRDDEALAARVRRLRVHGMEPVYVHHEVGMNGRMDEFQALVLRAKLPMLEGWHAGRRRHAQWYIERLKGISPEQMALPLERVPGRPAHLQPVHHPGEGRPPGRAPGPPEGPGHRLRHLLPHLPARAALLPGPGLPQGPAARIRTGRPGSAEPPGLPGNDRGHARRGGPGPAGLLQ